jgi:hypothetical protein
MPSHPALPYVDQACRELKLFQKGVAQLLGVPVRTVQRHPATGGLSQTEHYAKLVRAIHPRNPTLAAQIATAIGKSLPELGIHPAPTAVSAPLPPPRATQAHAEAVVCAAADAIGVVPRDVRPIVAAIFSCARKLDVDLSSLTALLAEHPVKQS